MKDVVAGEEKELPDAADDGADCAGWAETGDGSSEKGFESWSGGYEQNQVQEGRNQCRLRSVKFKSMTSAQCDCRPLTCCDYERSRSARSPCVRQSLPLQLLSRAARRAQPPPD